ncbi:hypothetical protein RUND412_010248 [Rhizina undulata]
MFQGLPASTRAFAAVLRDWLFWVKLRPTARRPTSSTNEKSFADWGSASRTGASAYCDLMHWVNTTIEGEGDLTVCQERSNPVNNICWIGSLSKVLDENVVEETIKCPIDVKKQNGGIVASLVRSVLFEIMQKTA